MCGITGWIDWKQDLTQQVNTLEKMTKTLAKRGPDTLNIYCDHHVALGHTRLIVVDPVGGTQPMTKNSKIGKKFTMVYNGELYNTEDLRKELVNRGYSFDSYSDTEVLLSTYMEWGENCVEHLNGIFAFAIWDHEKEKLFIARDRLGVKPLFYKESGANLLFGSELKAILASPTVKAEIDREGLQEVFGLGPSRTPGHGVFRGIEELRPAHFLLFDRNGLKVKRYWNVESQNHTHSLDETIENVRALTKDAIERQLVSDFPLCTFLSGGLDSSAISAVASNYYKAQGKGKLHTYSVDYEENSAFFKGSLYQNSEDRPWIEKMVGHFDFDHQYIIIKQDQLVKRLEDAVMSRDLPGMADIDSSLLLFSEEIKKDFTVALSGECADEIFGGYPWFHNQQLLQSEHFPWIKSESARHGLLLPYWQDKLKLNEYIKNRHMEIVKEVPILEGENTIEARRRELFYTNMIWFMTTLLERKDRMSMAASLEVRVPFADHRLVQYAWNIPWDMKMLEGREKGILRKAFKGILPDSVLYRKKSPYPKTYHPTYMKLVKEMLQNILNNNHSPLLEFVSKERLKELMDSDGNSFNTPWFGQLMSGPQLIAHLAQINIWLKHYNINVID